MPHDIKKNLNDEVEPSRKSTLSRYSQDNVLKVILEGLPEDRREQFRVYREAWLESDKREKAPPFPLNLYIEPVSNCNLHCRSCVRSRDSWQKEGGNIFSNERLGFETFKRIVDEGATYGLPAIWMGASGEALLEKNISRMMSYAYAAGIVDTILITNGTLLEKDIADKLLSIPITRLSISIDAFSAETYKRQRGGDYKKLMENIGYFLNRRSERGQTLPILRVTFVDQPENSPEKDAFVEYWSERAEVVDVQKCWNFDITQSTKPLQRSRQIDCAHPWRSLFVMAGGDVYPCCSFYAMSEHYLGNIGDSTIKEIWESDVLRHFRDDLLNGNYRRACQLCNDSAQGVEPEE